MKGRYLLAGFITLLIFLLGMLLGLVVEGKRVDYIQTQSKSQNLDFVSLQLQYQLISELSQERNCPAVSAAFNDFLKELGKTEERLIEYDKEATINKEDFALLKQEYVQAEVNYWMLAKRTKDVCKSDFVTLLYFYAPSEICKECDNQGFVLTYLKDKLKDKLLIFSFDSSFTNEQIIGMLTKTYNITAYPTLILENETVSGFHDSSYLMKEICKYYNNTPEICKT